MAGLNWPPEKTFKYQLEDELTVEINAYENTEKDITKRGKNGNKKIQEQEGR